MSKYIIIVDNTIGNEEIVDYDRRRMRLHMRCLLFQGIRSLILIWNHVKCKRFLRWQEDGRKSPSHRSDVNHLWGNFSNEVIGKPPPAGRIVDFGLWISD